MSSTIGQTEGKCVNCKRDIENRSPYSDRGQWVHTHSNSHLCDAPNVAVPAPVEGEE